MKQIHFLIIIFSLCNQSIADSLSSPLDEKTKITFSKLSGEELCESIEDANFKTPKNICTSWGKNIRGIRGSCLEWGSKANKQNYINEFKRRKYAHNKCILIKQEKEQKHIHTLYNKFPEKACESNPPSDTRDMQLCSEFALIDEYIKSNSLNEYGFGDIKVGHSIEEASKASGIDMKKYHSYSEERCGSYVFGKGGLFNVGKIRFLTTNNIIKRIDIWDVNVNSIFKLKLNKKYKSINKSFVKSQSTEANHYGGKNYLIQLLKSGLVLRVHTIKGIVNSFAIGVLPEVNFIEGCA